MPKFSLVVFGGATLALLAGRNRCLGRIMEALASV